MAYNTHPDEGIKLVRVPTGQSLLLDPSSDDDSTCIEVMEGIARVYCPCEETEGMTLAFLQEGDLLRTDRLCSDGVCVEAVTPLAFKKSLLDGRVLGYDPVNEWTLQLLRIRHLSSAEQRLQALLALLVNRLGRRCGAWCQLPFRLTHERIGELIGSTRVTSTRLISRLRNSNKLVAASGIQTTSLCPTFVETSPLIG